MLRLKRPKNLALSLTCFILLPLLLVVSPALTAQSLGLVWNKTASLPVGLWRKVGPFSLTATARGRYVLFCPPDNTAVQAAVIAHVVGRGHCPGGRTALIKEVVGVPGDVIELKDQVFVNGRPIANSAVNADFAASCGLNLPGHLTLAGGHLWLMSSYAARSFDSRYFGPVEAANIEAFVEPLFTF